MTKILDILIPRFITEKVAANCLDDGTLQPICSVHDLTPHDRYDCIVTVRAFNLFGFGLFARMVEE